VGTSINSCDSKEIAPLYGVQPVSLPSGTDVSCLDSGVTICYKLLQGNLFANFRL